MQYRCPTLSCNNPTVYSEAFINGFWADGVKSNHCLFCEAELTVSEVKKTAATPAVHFKGDFITNRLKNEKEFKRRVANGGKL